MSDSTNISPWMASFPAEIIVCDANATIIEMNDTVLVTLRRVYWKLVSSLQVS